MAIEISLAESAEEISAARRFWYEVYVVEMERHQSDERTSHEARELSDPFDEIGALFVARDHGRVVGTVLGTQGRDTHFGYYDSLYQLHELPPNKRLNASLTNKLIVAPEKRRSTLALKLASEIYRLGLSDGVTQNYIDCNAHLVGFFKRMGFRRHRGWVIHKDYGLVYSLVLHLEDIDHLRTKRSPLISHYESFRATTTQPNPQQTNGANNSECPPRYPAAI